MTPQAPSADFEIVKSFLQRGFKLVFWPGNNDWKGPHEKDWINKTYGMNDYHEGFRVGIMHGVLFNDIAGHYLIDVDIDWGPGVEIAKALLPVTQFIWGRTSKKISHCLYTAPDVIPMYAYKDIGKDGKTLIEFRADKHQSMAPPSIWEKDGVREPLKFIIDKDPTMVQSAEYLQQRVCLAAIGMLLASHLGHNGFGHEVRLAWAGFLLRAGINVEDLQKMGIAISRYCNNLEEDDIERVLQSTRANLQKESKRVKGGPALAKLIGEPGNQVVARINEWLKRDSDFARDKNGKILLTNQDNIRSAVSILNVSLRYNQFVEQPLIDMQDGSGEKAVEDYLVDRLWLRIDREFHFLSPINFFRTVIGDLARENTFHPVRDYLATLSWDGEPRIDTWLIACAGAEDTPYIRAVSSIMLIAGVKRVLHPGCKYDEIVIWESAQGTNKSSAAQALCPDPRWFSDDLSLNLHAQQMIENTLGKWIIEASDLAGKKKAELEQLKAMLSRQVDGPARMAYAHASVSRPRHFILIGTTNDEMYLSDPTGGRRFWPMKVQRFNLAWIMANRDQLWAEALVREAAGESIRLHESLWPHAAVEQEKRREKDAWQELIEPLLYDLEFDSFGRRILYASAIWLALGIDPQHQDQFKARRISTVMQNLGFANGRKRKPGEKAMSIAYIQVDNRFYDREVVEVVQVREPGDDDVPF
jgi:hypothetical protein